jgi:hypothetical protein
MIIINVGQGVCQVYDHADSKVPKVLQKVPAVLSVAHEFGDYFFLPA